MYGKCRGYGHEPRLFARSYAYAVIGRVTDESRPHHGRGGSEGGCDIDTAATGNKLKKYARRHVFLHQRNSLAGQGPGAYRCDPRVPKRKEAGGGAGHTLAGGDSRDGR